MRAPVFARYFMKDGRPFKAMTDGTELAVGDSFAILASARTGETLYHGTTRFVRAAKGDFLRHNQGLSADDVIFAEIDAAALSERDLNDLTFLINRNAGAEAAAILKTRAASAAA